VAGRVGVLALQGAFREHVAALGDVGVEAVEVRLPRDMRGLAGLVIPGGESSTMSKLIEVYELEQPIRELHAGGGALMGTCAGMIVLSAAGIDARPDQRFLGLIDIDVRRNAYGRQLASFEAPLHLTGEDLPLEEILTMHRDYLLSLSAEHFPHLHRAIDDLFAGGADERFEFGLDLILRGIGTYARPLVP